MLNKTLTALITPFTIEQEIDFPAYRALIQRQMQCGTEGLVIFGTTGESSTLSEDEKLRLLEVALEEVDGMIPIVVGSGDNSTRSTVEFTKQCKARGAQGALIISPYYNRPTERGVFLHMTKVASVGLPLIFYYHPGRCGSKLSSDCIKEILSIDEVVGLKDCSFDKEVLAATRKRIYCGNDRQFLEMAEMGVEGSISVVANIFPASWKKIVSTKDKELFTKIDRLLETIDLEVNPQPIKYLCSLARLCENEFRLPMTRVSEESEKLLENALRELSIQESFGSFEERICWVTA